MDWKEKKARGLTPPEPTVEEQERFMGEALNEARLAYDAGEVPIGAVVVRNGEVVGRGHNRRESDKNALAHAEVLAIDEACKALGGWRLWECDLYVTLEPCPMCAGALVNARVRNVYYGARDEKAGSVESVTKLFDLPYNHRPKAYGGVREEECAALLSEFFGTLRRNRESRNS